MNSGTTFQMSRLYHQRFLLASTFLSSSLKPERLVDYRITKSSASALTSAARRSPRSYHRHPSSPPTGAYYYLQVPRCLPATSLPTQRSAFQFSTLSSRYPHTAERDQKESNALSTGKSSNSSSSSNAAAGFPSFDGGAFLSGEPVFFAAGAAPDVGAADIM